ncbi:MAG: MarR family transcriptional regulator [Proteobacteria bacterium]|nr:MarR family transcriptional regulator [Pseudomonadota bacterium]
MLTDAEYQALADFRFALRGFYAFSEAQAAAAGLSAQQHQALLAIRGSRGEGMAIGDLADRLALKPHTVSELIDRMAAAGLVERQRSAADRRRVALTITPRGEKLLGALSAAHRDELRRMRPLLIELLASLG